MKRILCVCFIFCVLTMVGCRTKYLTIETTKVIHDSIALTDTVVQVELVPYLDSVAFETDSSHLENEYAWSNAEWDGLLLHHSLGIKKKPVEVRTEFKTKYRTIQVETKVPYEVVREKELSWWQRFRMGFFWYSVAIILILAAIIAILIRRG